MDIDPVLSMEGARHTPTKDTIARGGARIIY